MHITRERVGVHADFGMIMGPKQCRAFHADGAIAQRRPFRAARGNANMPGHSTDVLALESTLSRSAGAAWGPPGFSPRPDPAEGPRCKLKLAPPHFRRFPGGHHQPNMAW